MKPVFSCLLVALLCAAWTAVADDPIENARLAQEKVDQTTADLQNRLAELEKEYNVKKGPLYTERGEILAKIDGFWGKVFMNHPSHTNWMKEKADHDALREYLTDVQVEEMGHAQYHTQYKIKMFFKESNPYFSDAVLWREIDGMAEDADVSKISGVNWRVGHEPTLSSFFNFFEKKKRANFLEGHTLNDIAHVIKYEFWPNPFTYHDLPNYEDFAQHGNKDMEAYMAELNAANHDSYPSDQADHAQPDHHVVHDMESKHAPVGDEEGFPVEEAVDLAEDINEHGEPAGDAADVIPGEEHQNPNPDPVSGSSSGGEEAIPSDENL